MAKKEAATDLWVHSLLQEAKIHLDPQGSTIREIDQALKTASKSGSGKVGFPEYTGVVGDFLLVIENKADLSRHVKVDEGGVLSLDPVDVKNYAVNGAVFYGKHLAKNTSYKKILAFGISGDPKRHRISPVYIDETEYYRELSEVESFISFSAENIDEYYIREVLKEETNTEKELGEILKDAAALHEDLRNYGNLKDIDKPLIVSGILLALREAESKNFSIDDLTGDAVVTDGQKIFNAIHANLTRSRVAPEVKKDKILSQFTLFKNSVRLNEVNATLAKTPLRHFVEFLNTKIYKSIKYTKSSEDYLGRFYGEFMSYSGGDGQTLGIVLTPKHVTDLFCDLVAIRPDDVVLDPCAGTAGFLVAAMHHMLSQADNENEKKRIRQERLHGIEDQEYMFTIATTNMILRGDGKSNLINGDFLKENPSKLQLKQATIGMMNPPYSQGSKANPLLYEISFVGHLLNSLSKGARAIVIIPQSSVTGKTNEERAIKANILKKHTLEGVITLNKDTFYSVGTMPCIAIFTAGEPHPADKECKFIDFRNDGYKVSPHIGLIETEQAKDKKQHLLDVWFGRMDADSKFCVKTTVEPDDEWLHSFYYFNDEIPTDADFDKSIGDYLSFEFSMIMQWRRYLFEGDCARGVLSGIECAHVPPLSKKDWRVFKISGEGGIFINRHGKRLVKEKREKGLMPFLTAGENNNGVAAFVSNADLSIHEDVITVDMFGNSFFHGYKCAGDDNIYFFKNPSIGKYVMLFVSCVINKNKSKFSYGKQFRQGHADALLALLPSTPSGEPDYDYMEQYAKNIHHKKITEYLDYLGAAKKDLTG